MTEAQDRKDGNNCFCKKRGGENNTAIHLETFFLLASIWRRSLKWIGTTRFKRKCQYWFCDIIF